ncbi:hypothetical protein PHYPSEUDO_015582 [Phytophthora pseudosyringae]|uniref:Uncharacterized protein n=1 Tax=Phytophthora pseudosyringae TaxID=221518 RepID=A0A8T1VYC3_9STRA|nr:hypothetical protein PHYPSEUDO_015582 [Phytophthora pseudosyringae]
MAPRSSFATEFVLRELLSALGAPLAAENAPADSFSESLSEDTESQPAGPAAHGAQSRVMLVRRTNSSQRTATLVDREFDVEAFVPSHVSAALQQERGYQTLGRLRGSVVRVTKYHFATMTRCLAADQQSARETSVSAPKVGRSKARVYLWVDALAIVEDNELAVQSRPEVHRHPLVAGRLQTLSDAELEKQLMIHQGLPPLRTAESDEFDDERPLLEEDCVIPEDQEQELEEQDEWGPPTTAEPQPTDSELIEENGSVPMPESQTVRSPASPEKAQSTQDSMASSGDLSGTSVGNMSVTLSGNPSVSLSGESSLDSQRFQFQQEDIRETFVTGSDVESSDTVDEDDEIDKSKKSTPSTPKSKRKTRVSGKLSSAHSSPAPMTPESTQNSWAIVDLTGDTPEKAPRSAPSFETTKARKEKLEPKTEAGDSQEEKSDDAAALVTSPTPSTTQQPAEKQTPAKSWNFLRRLASNFLGTPSVEDPDATLSDKEEDDSAENDPDATQILEEREADEEDKLAPEEFMSSQATVVLQYAIDNDEDVNAFEYEGLASDDIASPRSVAHKSNDHSVDEEHAPPAEKTNSADDLTLTEEWVEHAVTPQKRSGSKEDNTGFRTPSPPAHAATPGTVKRPTPTVSTRPTPTPESTGRGSSHPASPPSSKDPVLLTDSSGQLSPVKSPSKLVISVGPAGNSSNCTGFSSAESRGSKRRHQQTNSEDPSPATTVEQDSAAQPEVQNDGESRAKPQKRRRRDILSTEESLEAGSQSPQFERPTASLLSQRRLQSDHGTVVADSYSLDAVCRSLGSNARDQANEEEQARSSQQPRRAWKRYENLFPPLNMTRLKEMMAPGKQH